MPSTQLDSGDLLFISETVSSLAVEKREKQQSKSEYDIQSMLDNSPNFNCTWKRGHRNADIDAPSTIAKEDKHETEWLTASGQGYSVSDICDR